MDKKITRHIQRTDNLFKQAKNIEDVEMKAEWSKYLCVLASGLLENSVRIMITEYTIDQSAPNISNYVSKKIEYVTNLKDNNIKSLLSTFNKKWKKDYEKRVTDELKDAIDSIVANRHKIAHGGNVGLSFVRMLNYYNDMKKVIKIIDEIINEN